MPVRTRKPNEIARQVMPLMLLGIGLIGSNAQFTIIDDEPSIWGAAAQPVRATLALFWSGKGQHEHPPLYDIFFHFWLRLTGGALESLRVPSILFFLAGLFLLARAAGRLGGPSSAQAVVWLRALWALRFSLRASGRVVCVCIFSGRGGDACLPAISGRSEFRALGVVLSAGGGASLDELFRLGHPWMSRDRSASPVSRRRAYSQSRDSPTDRRAFVHSPPSGFS